MFPKKVIGKDSEKNDIDLGEICSRWAWKIIGSLKNVHSIQSELLMIIWLYYQIGTNPDTDSVWHIIWMKKGLPLFTDKIDDLPATGKIAPMDKLEKEDYMSDIRKTLWE